MYNRVAASPGRMRLKFRRSKKLMPHTNAVLSLRKRAPMKSARLALFLCLLSAAQFAVEARAVSRQPGDSAAEMEQRVEALMGRQQYTDALPLLEKLVIAEPDK